MKNNITVKFINENEYGVIFNKESYDIKCEKMKEKEGYFIYATCEMKFLDDSPLLRKLSENPKLRLGFTYSVYNADGRYIFAERVVKIYDATICQTVADDQLLCVYTSEKPALICVCPILIKEDASHSNYNFL